MTARKFMYSFVVLVSLAMLTSCDGNDGDGHDDAVKWSLPIASAGNDFTLAAGQVATLDGSDSLPGTPGNLVSFEWSFISLPAGSETSLNSETVVNPSFIADVPGTYELMLIVYECGRAGEPAYVTVTADVCSTLKPLIREVSSVPESPVTGDVIQMSAWYHDPDNDSPCSASQQLTLKWAICSLPAVESKGVVYKGTSFSA